MPNFDKTGPAGQGRVTGRGDGPCNTDVPRNQKPGFFGRFFGRGRGNGAGRGRGFGAGSWFGRNGQPPVDKK